MNFWEKFTNLGSRQTLMSCFSSRLGAIKVVPFFCAALLSAVPPPPDQFHSFAELSAHYQEEHDFNIRTFERGARLSVFAIHGGGMEPGTSQLSREIAGLDLNLYLFNATLADPDPWVAGQANANQPLHLTSKAFDEPRALKMTQAEGLEDCVSIHGFGGADRPAACVGGGNERRMTSVGHLLSRLFLDLGSEWQIEFPCTHYPGKHRDNIINRCPNQGVQIEFSRVARKMMVDDPELMRRVAETVRAGFKD